MAVKARESIALFSTKEVYDEIYAQNIRVGNLEANSVTTQYLTANYITATDIAATYVTTQKLQTDYLDAVSIAAAYASISRVEADEAAISNLQTNKLSADYASIINQNSENISTINLTVANKADIDLLNTELINGQAIVTQLGYINNATITDLTTDKLRILGQDGLYYAINVSGGAVSASVAQADLNTYGTQLTGETLIDGTVVADKLFVNDLSAITGTLGEAYIGGLKLESSSIHSTNKTSVATGTGMLINSAGEMGLVGTNGSLLFYDDANDNNKRKLSITADSLFIGSTNMSTVAGYAQNAVSDVTKQYYQSSSIEEPIDGQWVDTLPTIDATKYLWTRDKLETANGSFDYTDPVCDTAYVSDIVRPDIETAKAAAYESAYGLVIEERSARLEALESYVLVTDMEAYQEQMSAELSVQADQISAAATKIEVNQIVTDLGEVQEFKTEVGNYLTFDADNGLTLSALHSAVKTVLTNSAWQLKINGTMVQQVDATDGAQFTQLKLSALSDNATPKLIMGKLAIVVESDGTLTGKVT